MIYSLYLHVPFCKHRCAYCDFNTYAGQEALIPDYVDALVREIESVAHSAPEQLAVHTIFFGGGTPSLLTSKQFEQIFRALRGHFDLSDLETSLEANPGTVSLDTLRDLRSLGFNRISFGVQSFHANELRQLERIHDPFDVFDAVTWARRAGFENLNLDLIFGLPQQSLDRWSATVKRAVGLAPEHLSLYALTVEHGTPFGRWAARGLLPVPDADAAAEMYEWAGDFLSASGYEQYEISNWAKPGFQCEHNLQTWRNQPYLGFGAGAHGYAAGVRYSNVLRIKTYIERLTNPESRTVNIEFPFSPATVNRLPSTVRSEMQETMMLGLRLTSEGVSAADFAARFGVPVTDVFGKEIDELLGLGLLEWVLPPSPAFGRGAGGEGIIRLTKRARLLGNQVFIRFVD
ncbi:MAG: oxygen-independent coproporphyrinogen III oxidase [Anaerolineaceae bacterium]|nr:MAG: oxygen-independent coproporphyrinogen III oxidase [Anaerolineaceae bacterium]